MNRLAEGRRGPFVVGLVALALVTFFAIYQLSRFDWDLTQFVAFGEEAVEIRAYAEDRLGPVKLRSHLGHDGRFFFVQANDPWVLAPGENALILDRPLYRSQRMLYPMLVGGFGLLSPEAIVWGMLVVNLLAMGMGSWAVAWLASSLGGTVWVGLAFLLNIGLISELNVGGAGVVASAAAFGALAFLVRGWIPAGIALLALAALSREVMLIVAAGSAFYLWRRGEKRQALAAGLIPLMAVIVWAVYLRLRIGVDSGLNEVQEIGLPFLGVIEAFSFWITSPIDLVVGLAMLLMLGLFVRRAVAQDNIVGWGFLGFVPLALMLTEQVWHSYYDITRAIAPLLTAFAVLVATGDDSRRSRQKMGGAPELHPS